MKYLLSESSVGSGLCGIRMGVLVTAIQQLVAFLVVSGFRLLGYRPKRLSLGRGNRLVSICFLFILGSFGWI